MIFAAERASELFYEDLLTDRSIIDVMAFTKLAKSIGNVEKMDFEDLYSRLISEYDYVFYISPQGVDIEDNGTRTTDSEYRDDIDYVINRYIELYEDKFKNFNRISGTTEDRIKQVLEIISL